MSSSERQYVSKLVPTSEVMLFAIIVGLSFTDSVLTGYDSSLMGSLNVMPSYSNYFKLNTGLKALQTASSYIGGCIGCMFTGQIADWRGRRVAIWLSSVITFVAAVIQTASVNSGMFIFSRILIGVGIGVAGTATPTLIAELAKPSYRGLALALYYSCWSVGTILASGICYGTNSWNSTWAWRFPSLFQIVPSLISAVVVFMVPESPRWLINNERYEEALEVLAVVNARGDKEDQMVVVQYREICDTIQWEKTEGRQLTLRQAWSNPTNRRRLLLGASAYMMGMLSGDTVLTFYFGSILSQAGITDSTTQLSINMVRNAWSLLLAVLGSWCCNFLPRKWIAATSLGLFGFFQILIGVFTHLYGTSTNLSGIYATVAMIMLASGAYNWGINPLGTVYCTEVLSYPIRATGIGFGLFVAKASGLFATMVFPYSLRNIGWKTYIIMAGCCVFWILIIYFFWVETAGLTLEEVDKRFDGQKHSDVPDYNDVLKGKATVIIDGVAPETIEGTSLDGDIQAQGKSSQPKQDTKAWDV